MGKIYFGFALADSMFTGDCSITRRVVTPEQARDMVSSGVIPCLNPSHAATISAAKNRYGLEVEIPATPPQVKIDRGWRFLIGHGSSRTSEIDRQT